MSQLVWLAVQQVVLLEVVRVKMTVVTLQVVNFEEKVYLMVEILIN